jgi:hypothetical protein
MEMENMNFQMGLFIKDNLRKDYSMEWAVYQIKKGKLCYLDFG